MMPIDERLHSVAAQRNQGPILEQFQRLLLGHEHVLEIASGTGQHAAYVAQHLPNLHWQPSDLEPSKFASIKAWCADFGHVAPPLLLDVTAGVWDGVSQQVDVVYCANMLHVAPWSACAGLMQGAARHLGQQGLLILYGPYLIDGLTTAPSNLAFDADLRQRDSCWGLRNLRAVVHEAGLVGLALRDRISMPANNFLLVFGRVQ